MPIQKGYFNGMTMYRWGEKGKWYHSRAEAEQQGRAIEASKSKAKKKR